MTPKIPPKPHLQIRSAEIKDNVRDFTVIDLSLVSLLGVVENITALYRHITVFIFQIFQATMIQGSPIQYGQPTTYTVLQGPRVQGYLAPVHLQPQVYPGLQPQVSQLPGHQKRICVYIESQKLKDCYLLMLRLDFSGRNKSITELLMTCHCVVRLCGLLIGSHEIDNIFQTCPCLSGKGC